MIKFYYNKIIWTTLIHILSYMCALNSFNYASHQVNELNDTQTKVLLHDKLFVKNVMQIVLACNYDLGELTNITNFKLSNRCRHTLVEIC